MEGASIQEGYPRPQELFIPQQRDFERKKAEIRETEEKRKRKYAERQERERQYVEKMRNGTLEQRERERVYQEEKKRNGGLINDVMERRQWGLVGSSEVNMEVLQDELCFILDFEGFFLNKTFHVRELAYYTWNGEHERHAFFIPVP